MNLRPALCLIVISLPMKMHDNILQGYGGMLRTVVFWVRRRTDGRTGETKIHIPHPRHLAEG